MLKLIIVQVCTLSHTPVLLDNVRLVLGHPRDGAVAAHMYAFQKNRSTRAAQRVRPGKISLSVG
jgi:hypothetical protein